MLTAFTFLAEIILLKESEHRKTIIVVKKYLGAIQRLNGLYSLYRVRVSRSVTKALNEALL